MLKQGEKPFNEIFPDNRSNESKEKHLQNENSKMNEEVGFATEEEENPYKIQKTESIMQGGK